MPRRRRGYDPSFINSEGVRIAFNRDVHSGVAGKITEVSKFIASLGIPGIEILPKSHATQVTILHNETVRRYFMQRQKSKSVLDTADLEDLAYRIHVKHGDDTPSLPILDPEVPFSVDDNDVLVIDLINSNELQIDRCRILKEISEVTGTKALNAEDIDALITPITPSLPLAKIDKRLMGDAYDDFVMDPTGYIQDEALGLEAIDSDPLQLIPPVVPLGKLSIQAVSKRRPLAPLPEYFPDADFDGVKKISYA